MFDCYQLHEVNSGTANQITQSGTEKRPSLVRKKAERKNGGKGEMDGVKYVFASPGYITVASPLSQVRRGKQHL